MPVDTHVHRVAGRLGLLDPGVGAEAAHGVLTAMAGPAAADIYAATSTWYATGARLPRARPACDGCPLSGICRARARFRSAAAG